MNDNGITKVGIGFATGRKSFQKILKTYVYNWEESGMTNLEKVNLCLFVAYDLKYSGTQKSDYTNIREDVNSLINETFFIGNTLISQEINTMAEKNIITEKEARLIFRTGYAGKRNAVLYSAIKNKMDYLLFLDDDEYPISVSSNGSSLKWEGQHVLSTHLRHIGKADITNGHHCGYISPIPYMKFNDKLNEADFRMFIEAISNDIVNYETIRTVMENGGVTYANPDILSSETAEEVEEVNHCKFISGANLCINLTTPEKTCAFYNPPEARGEDTFFSTCLHDKIVLRVPCYTFHDGFSQYKHIMDGVLPVRLKHIEADTDKIIKRFYRACIGWVRYKPLLLYITQRDKYEQKIEEMHYNLSETLPKLCEYFGKSEFMNIINELDKYSRNVRNHYASYLKTQEVWRKITEYLDSSE